MARGRLLAPDSPRTVCAGRVRTPVSMEGKQCVLGLGGDVVSGQRLRVIELSVSKLGDYIELEVRAYSEGQ